MKPLFQWCLAVAKLRNGSPEKSVALALVTYADGHDTIKPVYPANETLAEDTGMDERDVRRALAGLVERGLIRRVARHRQTAHTYMTLPGAQEPGLIAPGLNSPGVGVVNEGGLLTPGVEGLLTPPISDLISERNTENQNPEVSHFVHGDDPATSDDGAAPWPTDADAPETESDEADPFDALATETLDALVNATAPVTLTPSVPSQSGETPQVPPPPLSPAIHTPAPVATVYQPALPALSAPAVATDAPAVERKPAKAPRKRKPAVEGAEDTARAVSEAWDAAWASTFRRSYQACAETCANVGKSRCKEHFPGYAWTKGEIMQIRAALKSAWTAPRLVRLMPIYHRELDGKNIPRTVGSFLRAASTIEARHPAPASLPPSAQPIDRSIPTYIPPFKFEPRPERPPLALVPKPAPRPEMSREDAAREIASLRERGYPEAVIREMQERYA